MNTRNHLLALVAGAVMLAGCQSLEVPPQDNRSDVLFESTAAERTAERRIHPAMTIPRPRPPQADPLVLGAGLPEPGVPALPENLAFSEPNPDRQVPDGPAEPEAVSRPAAVPFLLKSDRFNLASPSRPGKVTVLAFGPSSRALGAAEQPPTSPIAAVAAAPVKVAEPAEGTGTAVAVSPAAAAPRAGAKTISPPESPSRTPHPEPASRQSKAERTDRELVARKGDPIAIDLEGSGWIYTGLRSGGVSDTGDEPGVDFISRRNSSNRTSFNFKARDYGDYELTFQYQDHRQAVLRSQVVHLQVVPEQDFEAAVQRQQPAWSAGPERATVGFQPVPGPPIRSADTLFDLGEYELALIEYKRNMRSGDPYLNDRLAECYERTGEHLAAVKYYRENLGLEGEYGDRAAVGLVRSSIATEDSRLLLEVLPSLFSLESVPISAELLEVARFQTEQRRFPVAIQALEQYVSRYPDGRHLDEVYYRLAQIYEVDSPYRDLESARHYYSLLYGLFPESLYADPAADRLNYLDRHFFLVQ
jgi:tetratricopeptide (TPR) repeat protein